MVGDLDGRLSLPALYEALAIIPVAFTVGDHITQTRETVPYFGYENVIVGLRYKDKMRGIIRPGNHLNSVIGVDLQCYGKNLNLKISPTKIQLTGARSEETGRGAIGALLAHCQMSVGHLSHVLSLNPTIRDQAITWVLSHLIPTPSGLRVSEPEGTVDIETVRYLSVFAPEFSDPLAFEAKIRRLLDLGLPFERCPTLQGTRICNGVYNYTLGQSLSLIKMAKFLHAKGYQVSYHNWSSAKKMFVTIPLEGDEAHHLTLNQSGAIRQTSPTSSEVAGEVADRFLSDLREGL